MKKPRVLWSTIVVMQFIIKDEVKSTKYEVKNIRESEWFFCD